MAVNREVLAQAEMATRGDRIVLDMDSSESPVHGAQEGSAYNGHFESVCYHPLFLFSEHGDCLVAALRPGNVHSADDWDDLLLPEIDRQQAAGKRVAFRADAAVLAPFAVDQAACFQADGEQCVDSSASSHPVRFTVSDTCTTAITIRRVRPPAVKISRNAKRWLTRPACIAGVRVSRPNCKAPVWPDEIVVAAQEFDVPAELLGATGVTGRATAQVRRTLANREVEALDERRVQGL